jgi:hypothetical protein
MTNRSAQIDQGQETVNIPIWAGGAIVVLGFTVGLRNKSNAAIVFGTGSGAVRAIRPAAQHHTGAIRSTLSAQRREGARSGTMAVLGVGGRLFVHMFGGGAGVVRHSRRIGDGITFIKRSRSLSHLSRGFTAADVRKIGGRAADKTAAANDVAHGFLSRLADQRTQS